MEPSNELDYNVEQVVRIMKEESYGAHISLIEQGVGNDGKQVMGISIESNLPPNILRDILKGLLENYEKGGM